MSRSRRFGSFSRQRASRRLIDAGVVAGTTVHSGSRVAEIQHLHGAVGAELDVRGLQIAMDDPLLVRRFERVGNLPGDRQGLIDRDRAPCNALREILTLDEFHHEGVHACRFLESVDRRDVGMIQRGESLRLSFKPSETLGLLGERVRQDLDRDLTTQRRVRRSVHLPHAAFADRRGDVVDAEASAGGQGQLCREYKGGTRSPEADARQPARKDLIGDNAMPLRVCRAPLWRLLNSSWRAQLTTVSYVERSRFPS
jgi:hypothetical protein